MTAVSIPALVGVDNTVGGALGEPGAAHTCTWVSKNENHASLTNFLSDVLPNEILVVALTVTAGALTVTAVGDVTVIPNDGSNFINWVGGGLSPGNAPRYIPSAISMSRRLPGNACAAKPVKPGEAELTEITPDMSLSAKIAKPISLIVGTNSTALKPDCG